MKHKDVLDISKSLQEALLLFKSNYPSDFELKNANELDKKAWGLAIGTADALSAVIPNIIDYQKRHK